MQTFHFSFVPPYPECKVCIPTERGRRLCPGCQGSRALACIDCHGLASLICPDCDGAGRIRVVTKVPLDDTPVITPVPCRSCSRTGTVHCESCLGVGIMRCSDCRGIGNIKCDCSVSGGYAQEQLSRMARRGSSKSSSGNQWNIITGEEIESAVGRVKTIRKPQPWDIGGAIPQSIASSNNFANGSDQNVGNVITDRRMIRVNAPPGGRSSFSISTMFEGPDDRFTRK